MNRTPHWSSFINFNCRSCCDPVRIQNIPFGRHKLSRHLRHLEVYDRSHSGPCEILGNTRRCSRISCRGNERDVSIRSRQISWAMTRQIISVSYYDTDLYEYGDLPRYIWTTLNGEILLSVYFIRNLKKHIDMTLISFSKADLCRLMSSTTYL